VTAQSNSARLSTESKQQDTALLAAVLIVLGCGAGLILTVGAYGGGVRAWFSWLTCWAFVPLGALCHAALCLSRRGLGLLVMLTATLIVAVGSFFYIYAFFVRPDAQSPLAFLVIPFYQCLAVIGVYLVALVRWIAHQLANSRRQESCRQQEHI
jgi:hypothetical protein